MFAYIEGKCVAQKTDSLTIAVGGIGFEIFVPRMFGRRGEDLRVYTHLYVRENEISLYGFESEADRNLFLELQTVTGVGPKLSLAILGTLTAEQFAAAIIAADYDTLTSVKGLGKKGASRLVVELRDKLAASRGIVAGSPELPPGVDTDAKRAEVLDALRVLGFTEREAGARLQASYDPELSLEENVRAALRKSD
ncbi:MAG: Holliday junction branch migration protein RuvA [Clostridiaceae bacterium]|jgi:Holliday junction DNA helicase RuvA|nr:Holliday junction branch migration protein RuvA [Clostridiaceae bacterium]